MAVPTLSHDQSAEARAGSALRLTHGNVPQAINHLSQWGATEEDRAAAAWLRNRYTIGVPAPSQRVTHAADQLLDAARALRAQGESTAADEVERQHEELVALAGMVQLVEAPAS